MRQRQLETTSGGKGGPTDHHGRYLSRNTQAATERAGTYKPAKPPLDEIVKLKRLSRVCRRGGQEKQRSEARGGNCELQQPQNWLPDAVTMLNAVGHWQ